MNFELSLVPTGTVFQQRVWQDLISIQYGETESYVELAKFLNALNPSCAVRLANSKNRVSIFVPCHLVIGSNGKLIGYAGGIKHKERLLNQEAKIFGMK